jgi:hypothetical protein
VSQSTKQNEDHIIFSSRNSQSLSPKPLNSRKRPGSLGSSLSLKPLNSRKRQGSLGSIFDSITKFYVVSFSLNGHIDSTSELAEKKPPPTCVPLGEQN